MKSFLLHGLGPAFLALLALRIVVLARRTLRGRLPWTRLLIPAALLIEGLGLLLSPAPGPWRAAKIATALTLELGLLALMAHRLWRLPPEPGVLPEDHLAKPLETFLPPRAARLIAMECVVLGMGLRFLLGGWRTVPPAGFGYSREAVLGALLPVLPLLLLGDLTLLEILLRRLAPGWRVLIHLLDLYGILWMLGLWSAMRLRPHQIRDGILHLHLGFIRRASIPLASIETVETVPHFMDDPEKAAFRRHAYILAAAGPPQLLLKLRDPLPATGLFGPLRPQARVILAVDEPQAMRAALGA